MGSWDTHLCHRSPVKGVWDVVSSMDKIYCRPNALPLWTLLMGVALKQKESAKKMCGGAQCFFQLPEEARHVKGNQISPIKHCLFWGTSQRCCSDSGNPFAAPFYLLSRRPIYSSVVLREISRGNWHHYSLALDRLKVTASKFSKFPLAAWLTGLAIGGQ